MSPNHPQTIDLDALQGRLDGLAHEPLANRAPSQADADAAARAIEAAANGNGHAAPVNGHAAAAPAAEPPAVLPVPRLGAEAAANMTKLSKAAAEDIRQLGRLAFDAGKRVQEECEQMARDVEANGGTVALHLTGLSQLLADVGMSNRETLHRLLGGAAPPIVPTAGNGHAAEEAAGAAKAIRNPPLANPVRRTD
jgi:hypothetical protein